MLKTTRNLSRIDKYAVVARNLSRNLEIDHASFEDICLKVTSHGFEVSANENSPMTLVLSLETIGGGWWRSTTGWSLESTRLQLNVFDEDGYIVATSNGTIDDEQPRKRFPATLIFRAPGESNLLQGVRAFVYVEMSAAYKVSESKTQEDEDDLKLHEDVI